MRIFSLNGGHSRDVYHTKRMQRVFAVRFSGDGTYIFSGGRPSGGTQHLVWPLVRRYRRLLMCCTATVSAAAVGWGATI